MKRIERKLSWTFFSLPEHRDSLKASAGVTEWTVQADVGAHCFWQSVHRPGVPGVLCLILSVDTDSRVWRRAARSCLLIGRGTGMHCQMLFHYSPTMRRRDLFTPHLRPRLAGLGHVYPFRTLGLKARTGKMRNRHQRLTRGKCPLLVNTETLCGCFKPKIAL